METYHPKLCMFVSFFVNYSIPGEFTPSAVQNSRLYVYLYFKQHFVEHRAWNLTWNKKVLLHEHKRHISRRVLSTPCKVFTLRGGGGGGTPVQSWLEGVPQSSPGRGGGYPSPVLPGEGTPAWRGVPHLGYPQLGLGYPCLGLGFPHLGPD